MKWMEIKRSPRTKNAVLVELIVQLFIASIREDEDNLVGSSRFPLADSRAS